MLMLLSALFADMIFALFAAIRCRFRFAVTSLSIDATTIESPQSPPPHDTPIADVSFRHYDAIISMPLMP